MIGWIFEVVAGDFITLFSSWIDWEVEKENKIKKNHKETKQIFWIHCFLHVFANHKLLVL